MYQVSSRESAAFIKIIHAVLQYDENSQQGKYVCFDRPCLFSGQVIAHAQYIFPVDDPVC